MRVDDVTLKPIPGCPGYFAGSDGSIWSSMPGRNDRYKTLHVIRPYADKGGYLNVSLRANGRRKRYRVQRLIAIAFHGLCPDGMVARHRDGNKRNNRPGNLVYGTQKQNIDDKHEHGTLATGERNGNAKLTDDQCREIIRRARAGEPRSALAEEFGVCLDVVSGLKTGRRRPRLSVVAAA